MCGKRLHIRTLIQRTSRKTAKYLKFTRTVVDKPYVSCGGVVQAQSVDHRLADNSFCRRQKQVRLLMKKSSDSPTIYNLYDVQK